MKTFSFGLRHVRQCDPSAPANNTVSTYWGGNQGATSYAANWYVFGATDGGASIPKTFQDGQSNTIVFVEHYAVCQNTCQRAWSNDTNGGGLGPGQAAPGGPNIGIDSTPCY
jgi:hypothetical protein